MNLMEALKCDFCGGRLVMDDSREFATCEMCGTKYMKSTVQQKIQEIRGSVTIQGEVQVKQPDFTIRGGVLETFNGESSDVVIPENVNYIGDNAFYGCVGLSSVYIPDTVVGIGHKAFWGCEFLTSIEIPQSVQTIGDGAFENCFRLETVYIPGRLQFYLQAFNNTPWYSRAVEYFKSKGLCQHCGGEFKGVLVKFCTVCGREKDYGILASH